MGLKHQDHKDFSTLRPFSGLCDQYPVNAYGFVPSFHICAKDRQVMPGRVQLPLQNCGWLALTSSTRSFTSFCGATPSSVFVGEDGIHLG